jgi:Lon protease-like protein
LTATPQTLDALPLFPLQTALFPGGLLPLRIFEVRYLDMIGRCHKAGAPFGVVCLTQGTEVLKPQAPSPAGQPPGEAFATEAFVDIGTLARIDTLERPQPGLMMIHCTGTQRFRIRRREKLKHGLWVADVELLPDDEPVPVPEDLAFTRDALQQLVQRIEAQSTRPDDMPLQRPYRWDDCGWIANRWSELLPLSAEVKHRFMALDNPLVRLELVADALGQMGFKLPD